MAETTNLNIRIDKDLKERAEAVFADMDNLGLCLAGYHKAAGIERISRMLGDDIGFTAD